MAGPSGITRTAPSFSETANSSSFTRKLSSEGNNEEPKIT